MKYKPARRQQVTLHAWRHDLSKVRAELSSILRVFYPGYEEIDESSFRECQRSHNCDKLTVYVWQWHGEWADPSKEVFARFFLPNKKNIGCRPSSKKAA